MSESSDDKLSRLKAMACDDGGTWDLSGNDQAAITWAVEQLVPQPGRVAWLYRMLKEPNKFVIIRPSYNGNLKLEAVPLRSFISTHGALAEIEEITVSGSYEVQVIG